MTRILITGGTGFIGRNLVQKLLDLEKADISLLLREHYSAGNLLPTPLAHTRDRFHVVYADLRNFNLTLRAVREAQPTCVLHLAALGATDPFLDVHTAVRYNLTGTLNLLRACFDKTFTTQRLITARTPGELSAMNVYAASKAAAWNFCRMYARTQQWPIAGAMLFQCYGRYQSARNLIPAAVQAALAGRDFPLTAGTQKRDWIHVEDVVAGLIALCATPTLPPGTSVDLGTGTPTSVADVVAQIYALAGSAGRPLVGVLPDRPGEVAEQQADSARTQATIGWQAEIPLAEGLKRTIQWEREKRSAGNRQA